MLNTTRTTRHYWLSAVILSLLILSSCMPNTGSSDGPSATPHGDASTPTPSSNEHSIMPSAPSPEPICLARSVPIDSSGETYFTIKSDGQLLGWGRNENDAHGGGGEVVSFMHPNEIMSSVRQVSGGQWVTFMIDTENALWGIGNNWFGHLGLELEGNRAEPVKIMEDVICVSVATMHSLAVTSDGSLWVWGKHRAGIPNEDLDYENVQQYAPLDIMNDVIFAVAIRNGGYVIKSDYSLWEWGIVSPAPVKIMDDVLFVVYGAAIKSNGDLWVWDYSEGMERTEPILLLSDVIHCDYGAAVQKDGSLWVWGDNRFGQLGDGTNIDRAEPMKLMDDVAYAVRGTHCTLIVKTDGSLWQTGRLDGFSVEYATPYQIGEGIWLP